MTTLSCQAPLTYQQSSTSHKGLLIFLVIVLLISAAAAAGTAISTHADLKHGADAVRARQCLSGNYPKFMFHNLSTHRYGTVCQINDAWGIVITDEKGKEITAFLKNKMKCFDQVLAYMKNAGYSIVQ